MNAIVDNVIVDPYLDIDLEGLQLIEASAGTGKTYTLATLVTRLVVERDLRLGQILAVTFTEAATQELRARLRKRLALAFDIASCLADDLDDGGGTDPEAVLTRQIIKRQLQHEGATTLRARLRRAAQDIDLAAVFTIHGFCARVLAEHALQTGQTFEPTELIGSERELHVEIAADLWRSYGADPGNAELLSVLWTGPDALARDLGALLRTPQLLPPQLADTPDPLPDLQQRGDQLRAAFERHGDEARARLQSAIAGKVLNGGSYKPELPEQLWRALAAWSAAGDATDGIDPRIDRLTPATLAGKTNKGQQAGTPASPLFEAVAEFADAHVRRRQWLAGRSIALLHRLRADAVQRLAAFKRTHRLHSYDNLIDGVADALDGSLGDALARQLRAQYAIALVDEFQDTDARQWAIFRRVFGDRDNAALFLIGDPKQAIYGFRGGDVHTYLSARRDAVLAPPLSHNFRSRPGVLRAIEALYTQAGDAAFVDERIRFHPVHPGAGKVDGDYQINDQPAPALTIRVLPANGEGKPYRADDSRARATTACVGAIHRILGDARAGRATIDGQAVQAGDIAVLVRSHGDAARMQAALVAAGIPAVAAGKQSLFETEQAGELLAVFEALLHPDDEGRLRAALATVLLGADAAAIARLDTDGDWRSGRQAAALAWRERWQRHGPLALVCDLCAANAERLLGLLDGERRLTNLMQLGELLQEADTRALGTHGLVDWLHRRIAQADANDEQQLLRLESDARRVQILTLHKSKGLEFGLVFLPYAGIGRQQDTPSRHCEVPSDDGRVLHWNVPSRSSVNDDDTQRWQNAVADFEREQRAEDARLLYVGLTRARHALWLAHGPLYLGGATALAPMLAKLAALRGHADIVLDESALPAALPPLSPQSEHVVPPAREARRALSRDWWIYSFTQLTNETSGGAVDDERGARDEPEPAAAPELSPLQRRFSGSRFGNVLHAALEHVDFGAWRGYHDGAAPAGQEAPLRIALRGEGYAEADSEDGLPVLAELVGQTLNVVLPEGVRLCELPAQARRAEMEFHFALQPTAVDTLLATLHAHGVLRDRHAFGVRRRLEGLMTGKIDLVYLHDGRYYVLDYKSNRLPAYDSAAIDRAMADSEYTLQSLIYTLALHRWLRFRLGDGYEYVRDFGGVRYLFCRGLEAATAASPGVRAQQPPWPLIDALDAVFSARGESV